MSTARESIDTRPPKGYRVYLCRWRVEPSPCGAPALEAVFKPVQPPNDLRGDGGAARHRDQARAASSRAAVCPPSATWPSSCASRARRFAMRSEHAGAERAPGGPARPRRGHLRRRRAAAGPRRPRVAPWATGPRAAGLPGGRGDGRHGAGRRAGRRGRPDRLYEVHRADEADIGPFEEYRRADVRFHIGLAEAAQSPRLVAAMTEVQGQMSDLIARIAHPARCWPARTPSTGGSSPCCAAGTRGEPFG